MSAKISVDTARELRARIWFGLPLIAIGAFMVGDTARRLGQAWTFVGRYWPWILLGLACLNLVRSLFHVESLLAPGLLGVVALTALALRAEVASSVVLDWLLPLLVVLAGVSLLSSVGARVRRSLTRVLSTGRVDLDGVLPEVLRPRAVLGDVRVDLTNADEAATDVEVELTAVFGVVRLVVPKTWRVELQGQGVLLSRVSSSGPREEPKDGTPTLLLHVMGFCGFVSVCRR
ncbi:hypothetical protein [Lentzea sp. HUAS12]|uniref:hypothetical protein n=1 Tax=Lentzea sp. HUAS12 TaxID=2951806 RepID=UPI00209EBF78|nr:hypothetical protein [Lentzea sp. HUAS12]USX52482.1 hypothetical protein ND450_45460 [Lentzea sp. HUAS12]